MHLTIPAIFCICAQLSVASALTNNEDVVRQRLRLQNNREFDGNILSKLEEKRFNLHTSLIKNDPTQVQSRRFKRNLEESTGANGQYRFVCPNDEVYDAQEGKCVSLHPPGPNKPPEAPDSSSSSSTREKTFQPTTDAEGQSNESKTTKQQESTLEDALETSNLPSDTSASSSDSASKTEQCQTSEDETASKTLPPNGTIDTHPTRESSTDAAGSTTQPDPEGLVTQEKASTLNVFLGALLVSIILTTLIGITSCILRSRKKNQAL